MKAHYPKPYFQFSPVDIRFLPHVKRLHAYKNVNQCIMDPRLRMQPNIVKKKPNGKIFPNFIRDTGKGCTYNYQPKQIF